MLSVIDERPSLRCRPKQIQAQIDALEQERCRCASARATDPTLAEDRTRLEEIRVKSSTALLWDFLRQRKALRDAGRDPDEASERSADVVEKYWRSPRLRQPAAERGEGLERRRHVALDHLERALDRDLGAGRRLAAQALGPLTGGVCCRLQRRR